MISKPLLTSQNQHSTHSSESKLQMQYKANFVKLNHKCKPRQNTEDNKKPTSSGQVKNPSSQIETTIRKLSSFIQKMQQIVKLILCQKDVKWYITYALTSETQIMDSVTNSLNKFKDLLYRLREQQLRSDEQIGSGEQPRSDKQGGLGKIYSSNGSVLTGIYSQSKYNPPDQMNGTLHRENSRINFDILSFVLQYFEDHMISETHWSRKHIQAQKPKHKVDFFNKYFGRFKFNCYTQTHGDQADQGLSNLQLKETMSIICQQMDKQQKQLLGSQQQNDILIDLPERKLFAKPVEQTLNAILKIQDLKPIQEMTSIQKIVYLLDLQNKIFVSSQFVQSAAFFEDDITTLPRSEYEKVWQYICQNQLGDVKVINEQYKAMKMLMIITNASVIRELQADTYDNSWFKKVVFGLSFPRYFVDYERAKLQNLKFLRKPSVRTIKSIWNLPQDGFIKQIKKSFIFDHIQCNMQLYVPRTNSHNLKNFKNRTYDPTLDIFAPNKNSIRIRLLNHKQLDIGNANSSHQLYQTVIIHFHGGGFVALSSCTSQSYTRKWANALKVPVFSVDYGKPPEFRFPTPVMDCLDAYNFISQLISKYMNINPKRIFVTGDSAGGNLACSLTALTLKLQMKVPDGLLLAYPAVDTRTKFTPSRLNSFNDIILYPTLLLLCMQEYLGDVQKYQDNPLASPILLSEDYVSDTIDDSRWPLKWPKTIVLVGKKDPLYDDSLRLCQRLASSNIQFHCQIYKNLSHAFLSIDKMLPLCAQTIKDSIKFFQKLISGQPIGKKKLL